MPTLNDVYALEKWVFDWAGGSTAYTPQQQDALLTALLELREGWVQLVKGVELVERLLMEPLKDDDGDCVFCDAPSDDPTQHQPNCPRAVASEWIAAALALATDAPTHG